MRNKRENSTMGIHELELFAKAAESPTMVDWKCPKCGKWIRTYVVVQSPPRCLRCGRNMKEDG